MDALGFFEGVRLAPVLALDDRALALDLAQTLGEQGVKVMEITLRTAAALDIIEDLAAKAPGVQVGAGSVRSPEQAGEAAARGARFLVSPGATPALLEAAAKTGLPYVPGAETASEMLALMAAGYRLQKFFPAEAAGGAAKLRALSAPLPELRFFPTGGIHQQKAADYLALPQVACIGGSWFVPQAALKANDLAAIAAATQAALAL